MGWIEILTAAVAAYGAILSTYTLYLSRRDKRRRLTVTMSTGNLAHHGGGLSEDMLILKVANTGHLPAIVQAPAIRLPNGTTLVFPYPMSNDRFPKALPPGESSMIWTPYTATLAQLREGGFSGVIRVVPICRDKAGGEHVGKAQRIRL